MKGRERKRESECERERERESAGLQMVTMPLTVIYPHPPLAGCQKGWVLAGLSGDLFLNRQGGGGDTPGKKQNWVGFRFSSLDDGGEEVTGSKEEEKESSRRRKLAGTAVASLPQLHPFPLSPIATPILADGLCF